MDLKNDNINMVRKLHRSDQVLVQNGYEYPCSVIPKMVLNGVNLDHSRLQARHKSVNYSIKINVLRKIVQQGQGLHINCAHVMDQIVTLMIRKESPLFKKSEHFFEKYCASVISSIFPQVTRPNGSLQLRFWWMDRYLCKFTIESVSK